MNGSGKSALNAERRNGGLGSSQSPLVSDGGGLWRGSPQVEKRMPTPRAPAATLQPDPTNIALTRLMAQMRRTSGPARAPVRASLREPAFFTRIVAWVIDLIVVAVPAFWFANSGLSDFIFGGSPEKAPFSNAVSGTLLAALFSVLYGVIMEASPWQATIGKRMCGLVVTDARGNKPSLKGVIIRNTLSRVVASFWLFAVINFIVGSARPDKRCVHDLISGTRVCKRA